MPVDTRNIGTGDTVLIVDGNQTHAAVVHLTARQVRTGSERHPGRKFSRVTGQEVDGGARIVHLHTAEEEAAAVAALDEQTVTDLDHAFPLRHTGGGRLAIIRALSSILRHPDPEVAAYVACLAHSAVVRAVFTYWDQHGDRVAIPALWRLEAAVLTANGGSPMGRTPFAADVRDAAARTDADLLAVPRPGKGDEAGTRAWAAAEYVLEGRGYAEESWGGNRPLVAPVGRVWLVIPQADGTMVEPVVATRAAAIAANQRVLDAETVETLTAALAALDSEVDRTKPAAERMAQNAAHYAALDDARLLGNVEYGARITTVRSVDPGEPRFDGDHVAARRLAAWEVARRGLSATAA